MNWRFCKNDYSITVWLWAKHLKHSVQLLKSKCSNSTVPYFEILEGRCCFFPPSQEEAPKQIMITAAFSTHKYIYIYFFFCSPLLLYNFTTRVWIMSLREDGATPLWSGYSKMLFFFNRNHEIPLFQINCKMRGNRRERALHIHATLLFQHEQISHRLWQSCQ